MKTWVVDYSVRYDDGPHVERDEEECSMQLKANTLMEAYNMALVRVQERMEAEDLYDAVIWNVGIVDDNVWDD